jgi:hypothetical protein
VGTTRLEAATREAFERGYRQGWDDRAAAEDSPGPR